ncbi:hypothetical protein AhSzw1_2 [Aeromonas phage AhSzw-1]|uniref:Uncharacterized protein n=1 Tax=Aeromonas phage AhSzw-1 TaxID=2138299 RepID=A0A2R4ALY1_9CAUD|nr:hypothetical protein HOT04_gp002 [Aeromonas phage AhSzw-1]AVR76038.1 hypothetical protein AhSzw1_2 [Aeromonas phage AhSzw-1]
MFISKGANPVEGRRIIVLKELTIPEGTYTRNHVFKVIQVVGETFRLEDAEPCNGEVARTVIVPLTKDEYLLIPYSI